MNAAATTEESSNKTKLEKIEARICELTESLAKLDQTLSASLARQAALASERQALVLAARVRKESAAQKRLDAIDQEISRLTRDIADDRSAVSDLTRELEEARRASVRSEWERRKAELCAALQSRLEAKSSQKIDAAVAALVEALDEQTAADQLLSGELIKFDRGLRSVAKEIGRLSSHRGTILAAKLYGRMPVSLFGPEYSLRNRSVREEVGRRYQDALESLDSLELLS